jgi:signal peptidase I
MIGQWLLSRTVRDATNLCKHVRKILNEQRDLLNPQAIDNVSRALGEIRNAIASKADPKVLRGRMANLEQAAEKWLKSHSHASVRENIEVVLVAVAVALGIRTFFLQPFKIPTGSMQPTLYGITCEDLRDSPGAGVPGVGRRVLDLVWNGISYRHVVAEADGMLEDIEPARQVFPFVSKQSFRIGGKWHSVWFPVDNLSARRSGVRPGETFLLDYAGIEPEHLYRKGDDLIRLKISNGDHLFVDRLTYNFRRPERGEILVFKTAGIRSPFTGLPAMPQDQFYVKRMVAMGGEQVQIGDDRHLVINHQRLEQSAPRFENVYSFDPKQPARENHYSGHLNDTMAARYGRPGLAPLFPDEKAEVTLRPNHYMVMGDNTMNSSDSRTWGDFSRTNVIGKYFFVYWPFSSRFGWAAR